LSYRRAPDSWSITDDKDPCSRVLVRCYAELNDYLPEARRQRSFSVPFSAAASIERLIDHNLQAGDRITLYPLFESFDVTPLLRLRDRPLRRVHFVADAHLGRLARYLRLLGFDTLFENDPGDAELARISAREGRILLSRDKRLLQRRILSHALWIPAIRPREQLAYLVDRLDLRGLFRPFTRCTLCNGRLVEVMEDVPDLPVPPGVRAAFKTFWRCEGCDRIYWQGSHYDRLRAFVEQLAKPDANPVRG
jgi:uncharacterized protein with PIN domain